MTEIQNNSLTPSLSPRGEGKGEGRFGKFEHLNLGFVSRFDIRISDFKFNEEVSP